MQRGQEHARQKSNSDCGVPGHRRTHSHKKSPHCSFVHFWRQRPMSPTQVSVSREKWCGRSALPRTGGRAEIGSFTFDWTHLRAQIRNFVVHGLEPADAAPLLRADLLQVDLKLLSPDRKST